jgi:hypothetical protein
METDLIRNNQFIAEGGYNMIIISIIMIILGIGMISADGVFLTILGIIVGGIGLIWLIRLLIGK